MMIVKLLAPSMFATIVFFACLACVLHSAVALKTKAPIRYHVEKLQRISLQGQHSGINARFSRYTFSCSSSNGGSRSTSLQMVKGSSGSDSDNASDSDINDAASTAAATPPRDPNVVGIELNDELRVAFMSYAMSTILGRALPDARDGLKPVHRRVLYAMQQLNLTPDSGYRKSARIVGEVLGKYHPHGDSAVYDAMVRMAQDFVMLHPLVSGHGNFGSVDNDPPAAMRYTESRLSSVAFDTLLADIKEDTVHFVDNFDGNEQEPVVLPARLPVLLINGASGIAVGMATNIPPHNMGELCDAVVALIDNPLLPDEKLFEMIPGPDFPTGGFIVGSSGARALHATGHGSVVMRAKTHIEVIGATGATTSSTTAAIAAVGRGSARQRNAIIITELPYMTNKAGLLEKIADLVNDKKLDGISDLRDETDREGMRVVIELKRDAVPAVVLNNLYKKTALQTAFSGNMLALVENGTAPRRLGLREALNVFIKFRFETIRRRTAHQLGKATARSHVLQGMLRALQRIDDIITLLKKSSDTAAARSALMSGEYEFTTEQAEAILSLTLRRLTAMEESKLKSEEAELAQQIATLQSLMSVDAEVHKVMKAETKALKKKHAVPRRTVITDAEDAELSIEDLIANDKSVIMITKSGYIKRVPILEFESQSRGGTGKAGARLSNADDSVANFFACNDHDALLFATNRGIAYSVKAHQIPIAARTAKGVPLPQVLPISGVSEKVTSVFPIDSFDKSDESLVLLTELGYVKKTPLRAFQSISARGLTIISLVEGDSLKWTRRCLPSDQVLIATKDGYATRFSADDVSCTGRTSRGVRALKLRKGDTMADMDILSAPNADSSPSKEFVFAVTEKGYGKRISIDEFRTQRRGGMGVIAIKFKKKAGGSAKLMRSAAAAVATRAASKAATAAETSVAVAEVDEEEEDDEDAEEDQATGADALSCMRVCSAGDEVVLSTGRGTVIRQKADDISVQSRTATGVLIQRMKRDDVITMVDIVPAHSSSNSSTIDLRL